MEAREGGPGRGVASRGTDVSSTSTVGLVLALTLVAICFWIRQRRRARNPGPTHSAPPSRLAETASPKPSEALVYVEADGSARELTEAEKTYVDTAFSPFDGARPYIKSRYDQRDGWGEIKGFLHRKQLPKDTSIKPAPSPSPAINTPEAVAASVAALVREHRTQ